MSAQETHIYSKPDLFWSNYWLVIVVYIIHITYIEAIQS